MTGGVDVRPIRPDDLPALRSMFRRCSPETRYRRFHGCVTEPPAAYLRRCLGDGPDAHAAFVAEAGAGRLVGPASAGPVPGAPGIRELGALVEDGGSVRVSVGCSSPRWARRPIRPASRCSGSSSAGPGRR